MKVSISQGLAELYGSIKTRIPFTLSPLQTKVALFVTTLLSALSFSYFYYRWNSQGKTFFKMPPTKIEQREREKAGGKHLTVVERMEKNRKLALQQQNLQVGGEFKIHKDLEEVDEDILTLSRSRGYATKKIIQKREVGGASRQGARSSMEDAEIALSISFNFQDETIEASLFGVFDGHGGAEASAYVRDHLEQYLKNAFEKYKVADLSDEVIWGALRESLIQLDKDYQGFDGTTVTVALILNEKIWFINVGDSRIILVDKDGTTIQATEDAKPNMERYKKKIQKLGGEVFYMQNAYRVNGNLAVARAIGDKSIKGTGGECCIVPNGKVTSCPLKDFKDGYMMLACDGVWDVASSDDAGKAIHEMAKENLSPEEMANRLAESAIISGSKDNITTIVIKL